MAGLNEIVSVLISRQTTPVATASFQIPLILTEHAAFSSRTRIYTSLAAVRSDFPTGTETYKIAAKEFGQSTVGAVPPQVVVGKRQIDSFTGSISTLADNTVYSVTINGVAYPVTSGEDATASQIAAALDAAVGTLAGINFVVDGDTFTISVATPGTGWSISSSSNISLTAAPSSESWEEAFEASDAANSTWYALTTQTHDPDAVMALAAAVQARDKLYGTSTEDSNFESPTHIGARLSAAGFGRTFWIYSPNADEEYPEAAWIGGQLPYTPGSNDWIYKRLAGVTVSNVSPNNQQLIENINGNYYVTVAGVNITQTGDMSDGLPIDLKKVA